MQRLDTDYTTVFDERLDLFLNGVLKTKKRKSTNGRNVRSRRKKPTDLHEKDRNYFFGDEIEQLLEDAKKNRYGIRDNLIILMMYRHGFRVSELVNVTLKDIDLKRARIWVQRVKGSLSTEQPIAGDELRPTLSKGARQRTTWLFISERQQQLSRKALNTMLERMGERLGLHAHPHKLRHSCDYYLADKGNDFRVIQDYLGHRDPKHTMIYTRIAGRRFEGLWR